MRFLLLLLLPLAANAEHHRDHATAKLDTTVAYLMQTFDHSPQVFSCAEFTDFQDARARNFHNYLDRAFEDIAEARELLTTGGDLQTARRLLSQPHKKAHKDGGVPSALQWVAQQTRNLRFLIGPCPENAESLNLMIQKMTLGWQFLDLALWHVNDAIAEQ